MLTRRRGCVCARALARAQQRDSLEYWATEHLRVSGLYWGVTALALLGRVDALPRDAVIAFLKQCQTADGARGAWHVRRRAGSARG